MKKTLLICSAVLLPLLLLIAIIPPLWEIGVINMGFMNQERIVKQSITWRELGLKERPYILCEPVMTTGFYWMMVQDENKNKSTEYVMITGADPMGEMRVKYDFSVAPNKFIFYVVERNEHSSEIYGDYIEYIVSDEWDILYPVRRGGIGLRSRYITRADLRD